MRLGIARVELDGALGSLGRESPVLLGFNPKTDQDTMGMAKFDPGAGKAGVQFDRAGE
ncbi:hypothetical protein D9M68_870220 [compost metagenome]